MTRTHEKVGPLRASEHVSEPVSEAAAPTVAEKVVQALKLMSGRWKLEILFQLFGGKVRRFSELERALPAISQKMLAQQLREMERDGMVTRIVHPEVPPKVEYRLTDWGQALCPSLDSLLTWAANRPDAARDDS
jgi:DNA-binding HxlR family transcriptional regulator